MFYNKSKQTNEIGIGWLQYQEFCPDNLGVRTSAICDPAFVTSGNTHTHTHTHTHTERERERERDGENR